MDARRRIGELESALSDRDAQVHELEQQLEWQREQMALLTKQVEGLTERLERTSRNSHLPPSSDPPGRAGRRGKDTKQAKEKRKS